MVNDLFFSILKLICQYTPSPLVLEYIELEDYYPEGKLIFIKELANLLSISYPHQSLRIVAPAKFEKGQINFEIDTLVRLVSGLRLHIRDLTDLALKFVED